MSYNFLEVSRDCHDETWDYDKKTKCGYSSLRNFPHSCYSLAWMTHEDGDVTTDEWKTDCLGFNEEYIIDWECDECEGIMKKISLNYGDTPVKFRIDAMTRGSICVDYNTREVYVYDVYDYNTPYFYTYVNGECVEDE